ncbi:MAG: hypothetical protein MR025_06170 [Helicobacter trogontum]|uniref:hypothetical protein n=1 Tax=Helicobacter trogontum TaxID=50960 RepID=UPI00242A6A20|nr:hypothetical protein [Helicobacter trogontum]MCI5787015.1 hypothetical protein [Helicobacter trogontum]
MAGSVVNYELDDKETQMENISNDKESLKLQFNNQKHINPTMLESNNEAKPTESIKQDSIKETSISTESNKLESKKPNDTKNKDNIKLDSSGDEIIWELKHKKSLSFFYSWLVRYIVFFGGIYCIIIGIQKYLSRDDNSLSITIALLVLVVMWFVVSPLAMYKTLNIKSIFLTNKNLIIQRYIGDKIVLPLGSFYVKITSPSWLAALSLCSLIEVIRFPDISKYWLELVEWNIENLDKLFEILKPHITEFLYNLNDEEYKQLKILVNMFLTKDFHTNLYKNKSGQFDIDKIDKLREERNVKSNL